MNNQNKEYFVLAVPRSGFRQKDDSVFINCGHSGSIWTRFNKTLDDWYTQYSLTVDYHLNHSSLFSANLFQIQILCVFPMFLLVPTYTILSYALNWMWRKRRIHFLSVFPSFEFYTIVVVAAAAVITVQRGW